MTRKLGIGRKGTAALASITLAATLACGGAVTGCSSSSSSGTEEDSGLDAVTPLPDGAADTGTHDTGVTDTGTDSSDGGGQTSDAQPDVNVSDGGTDAPELQPCSTPTFTPTPGTFTTAQAVTIATTTPDATIYYTTDGTNPTIASVVYSSAISVSTNTTLRALCTAPGFGQSVVGVGVYTISPTPGAVPAPQASPTPGTYNNNFLVSLTEPAGAPAGVTICYTLDGSTPSCAAGVCQGSSQTYTQSQISVNGNATGTGANAGKVTINALACKAGSTDGDMAAPAVYTLQVATPTLSGPTPGNLIYSTTNPTPTLATSTAGATGLYTTSANNLPTCSNGTPLSSLPNQLTLTLGNGAQSIYAIACKPGYLPSAVETGNYTVTLNPPSFNPAATTFNANTPVNLVDTLNNSIGTDCTTTDGSTPVCGPNNTCSHGNVVASGSAIGTVSADQTKLEAIACGTTGFLPSSVATSTYGETLAPIVFTETINGNPLNPANTLGVAIPTAASTALNLKAAITASGSPLGYDYICWSADGTAPSCPCTGASVANTNGGNSTTGFAISGGLLGLQKTSNNPAVVTLNLASNTNPSSVTLKAIGCLNAGDTTGNPSQPETYQPTAVASQNAPVANQVTSPTILPTQTTANTTVQVDFKNNDPTSSVNVYYSTGGATPTCAAGGGVTEATNGPFAPGASSTNSGPSVSSTQIQVQAIACDAAGIKTPSAVVSTTYTLSVAPVTISPSSGSVALGQAITLSSTTPSVVFHYATGGATASCASPSIAGAQLGNPQAGAYVAYYYITGAELNRSLSVIGCVNGGALTASAAVSAQYSAYTVPAPTFTYASGTYDDTLDNNADPLGKNKVIVAPGSSLWACLGAGAGCGVASPQCTGNGVVPLYAGDGNNGVAFTNGSTSPAAPSGGNAPATPTGSGLNTSGGSITLVTTSGTTLSAVACGLDGSSGSNVVVGSSAGTATYTLQTSGIQFSPTPGAQNAAGNIVVKLAPSTELPQAPSPLPNPLPNPLTASWVTSSTHLCVSSTQSVPAQPSPCSTFTTVGDHTGWLCDTDNGQTAGGGSSGVNGQAGEGSTPVVTLNDVATSTTLNAFTCRDGFTYQTSSGNAFTYGPYSHTVTFTGASSDFNASTEEIAGTNSANAFVSWDSTYLYVGYLTSGSIAADTSYYVEFYIGGSNGTGATTADTCGLANSGSCSANNQTETYGFTGSNNVVVNATGGNTADTWAGAYHVRWLVGGGDTALDQYVGSPTSAWETTSHNSDVVVQYNGNNFVEFRVPLADINLSTPGNFQIYGGLFNPANGGNTTGIWPSATVNANTSGDETAGANGASKVFQAENTSKDYAPNDTNDLGN